MCDVCVIKSVKDQMLSRRNLFKAVAVTAAGAAASAVPAVAMAQAPSEVVDMSHVFDEKFPTYFGTPGISYKKLFDFAKDGFQLFELTTNEHAGTHVDAPIHFSADGKTVDEIPVTDLVVPLCVVDIRDKAAGNPDAQVTPEDIKAWTNAHGPIPDKACVALLSGWGDKTGTDEFRNVGSDGKMHFPGFHIDATQMLLEETNAAAMAVDTLSLDYGISGDFATHYAWLPAGRYGIECLAGLEKVPASGATLVVGAPKTRGGTGGQARIFAMV